MADASADARGGGRSPVARLALRTMTEGHPLRRLRTLLTIGWARQRLVPEAALALLAARIMLLAVPFPKLAARWGILLPVGDPRLTLHDDASTDAVELARAIGWAVTATASVMPFKAMCIQQAVAARGMLARRSVPSVLHYGAGRDADGAFVAHAWLDAAGVKVTGYPIATGIAELARSCRCDEARLMAGKAGSALGFTRDVARFAGRGGAVAVLLAIVTAVTESAALALVAPLLALLAGSAMPGRVLVRAFAAIGVATPFAQLAWLLALIGALWVARGLLAWLRDVRLAMLTMGFAEAQRRRIVTRLAAAPWGQVAAMQHARIVQALGGDVARISQATQMLIQIVVAGVMLIAFALVALLLAPLLATIALGLLVLVGAGLALLLRRTHDIGTLSVRANLELTEASARFLGGLRVAASQNLQPSFVARFDAGLAAVRTQQLHFIRQQNSARLVVSGAALAVGAVIALVGRGWLDTPLPQLGALMLVLSRLGGPVSQIQQSLQQLFFALPAYAQLTSLAEVIVPAPAEHGPAPTLPEGATIGLDAVKFAHPARGGAASPAPVLDGVSLTLAPSEMVGLTGASGAGKSTLADLLVGLLTPQAGVVRVGDVAITGAAGAAWREQIAYAAQDPYLFHASVRENLLWGARDPEEAAVWAALETAAAADLVRALPDGLATVVGERGALLSGGERQRLAMARALLRGGRLLILDEATSAVDIATEARIFAALRAQSPRPTMLVIAHRAETLGFCDRVIRLDAGRIEAD